MASATPDLYPVMFPLVLITVTHEDGQAGIKPVSIWFCPRHWFRVFRNCFIFLYLSMYIPYFVFSSRF